MVILDRVLVGRPVTGISSEASRQSWNHHPVKKLRNLPRRKVLRAHFSAPMRPSKRRIGSKSVHRGEAYLAYLAFRAPQKTESQGKY